MKHRFLSRPKPLSMLVQAAALQKHRDTISVFTRGSSLLKWRGRVTPAAYCKTYTIDLEYRRDTRFVPRPRVIVLNPPLQLREGKGCLHRHGDQEPCLYYHHGNEWHSGMLIAHTIIPWASRWLYYYEIWLATGEWMGGGIHPSSVLKARQEIENRGENQGRV